MYRHILLYFLLFLLNLNFGWSQAPSTYYATNPNGSVGTFGAITIDGSIADWDMSKLIAQGVANDDPRIFRGSHEGPVYDLYALYASWDDTNLYLMWEYTNVTDVSDPAQGYPISDNGKPYNGDIPIMIALDVDSTRAGDGTIEGTGNSIWANGVFTTFGNGTDHVLMMSSKPGVGQPALFKLNANDNFTYDTTYVKGFAANGITYDHGDAFLSPNIYGINATGNAGYTPADLTDETSYIDFKVHPNHDSNQETFYEIKIPLTLLGVTRSYIETHGIGAMVLSTFGESSIGSLPYDVTNLDNATNPYSQDPSSSAEKEDADNITALPARIGMVGNAPTITGLSLASTSSSITQGSAFTLPKGIVTYSNGSSTQQTLSWSPALNTTTLGTTTYTGTLAGYSGTVSYTLTVTESTGTGNTCDDNIFIWDNATVYFLLTDRFNNGNTSNDNAYGRVYDEVGGFNGGDFAGITQKINEGYFDSLGVNAIWFTAPYEQIHEFASAAGSNQNYNNFSRHYAYHGYYPYDWTEMDDAYGTAAEFQAFVDAAHSKGIRLVMDIVLNHVGYDWDKNKFNFANNYCNWWVDENDVPWIRAGSNNTDLCAPACGSDDLTLCLGFLPDIRSELSQDVGLPRILLNKWDATKESTEINELNTFFSNSGYQRNPANHIIKWLTDWVRDYGIDAFRIDTYKHVEHSVWGRLKDQAQIALDEWRTANPSKALDNTPFWMVGEDFGAGHSKNFSAANTGKTDALINFNFKNVAANPLAIDGTYQAYANDLNNDPTWTTLNYISSHDVQLFDRNNLYNAATSLLLAPGAAQIFYGDETRRPLVNPNFSGTDYIDFNYRSFMNWNSIDQNLLAHWRKLGQFRQRHPSVGAGAHQKISDNPYVFKRSYSQNGIDDKVMVAVGTGSGSKTVNVSSTFADGTLLRNYYTKEEVTVSGGNAVFNVGVEGLILIEEVQCANAVSVNISNTPAGTNFPAGSATVTLTPSPADAVVTYTINGGSATTYSAPFQVSGGANDMVEVCATATKDGETSTQVCRTYTFNPVSIITLRAKNDGCSTPHVYVFDVNGVSGALAPWPGEEMTADPANPGWFVYSFEGDDAQVIFNCGEFTSQTDDLFVDSDACWEGGFFGSSGWTTCPVSVPTVTINPTGTNFATGSGSVSISGTNTSTIYYTTDGSTPNQSSTPYSGSFTVSGDANNPVTVRAIGYDASANPTTVVSETYTFDPASSMVFYYRPASGCNQPYVHLWNVDGVAGDYTTWPGAAMTAVGNGWFMYTLDAASTNLQFNCGDNTSQEADQFNITSGGCFENIIGWGTCPTFPPTVSITPASQNFGSGSGLVTLTGNNADAVYYTTDGSTPSQSSSLYTGPFTVSGDENTPVTVSAIAFSGSTASTIATETYTFNPPLVFYYKPDGACTTAKIHLWDVDGVSGPLTTWPGAAMTDLGNGWHKYTLDAQQTNLLFNCNGDLDKTPDQTNRTMGGCYDKSIENWVTCPTDVDPQPEPACPESILIDFAAVIDSTFKADSYIEANNVIDNGFVVNMYAGDSVVLKPGFHAKNGSTVHIKTQQCVAVPLSVTDENEEAVYYLNVSDREGVIIQENDLEAVEKPEPGIQALSVYPNPASDMVNIKAEGVAASQVHTIRVFNMVGTLVNQIEATASGRVLNMLVNTSHLPTGTYIVNVAGRDYNKSQKLVVMH